MDNCRCRALHGNLCRNCVDMLERRLHIAMEALNEIKNFEMTIPLRPTPYMIASLTLAEIERTK